MISSSVKEIIQYLLFCKDSDNAYSFKRYSFALEFVKNILCIFIAKIVCDATKKKKKNMFTKIYIKNCRTFHMQVNLKY